jgi:hypothetical protein
MSKRPPPICVWYLRHGETKHQICSDWYDFADWLKQEELAGRTVTFLRWEYMQ